MTLSLPDAPISRRYMAGTFFGMLRRTAAVTFDATRKAGSVWCELVEGMLKKAGDEVDLFMRDKVVLAQVFRFKEAFNTHVDSESALFCYLSRYRASLLPFYNPSDATLPGNRGWRGG